MDNAQDNEQPYTFKYYYIRDWYDYKPVITLCTVKKQGSNNLVSLGVAVCSNRDMPSKHLGKCIAKGRALKNIADGCVFSQQELKNCSVVREVINAKYDAYSTLPWVINTFLELMEFELYDYATTDL